MNAPGAAVRSSPVGWDPRRYPSLFTRWLIGRLRSRDFWIVQGLVAAITPVHYYLEASGRWHPVEHTVVIFYVIPIMYATLRFSREGGIATSILTGLLTLPDILVWHRHDYVWLEDAIPAVILVTVGIVLASRVVAEAGQRRQAEKARSDFQRLAARYRNLFETATDAVVVFDDDGHALLANPSACALFGRRLLDLLSLDATALLGAAAASRLAELMRGSPGQLGGRDRMQITLVGHDASERVVDVACAAVGDEGGRPVIQAVLRDVTVQRRREESLRLYAEEVTRAQEQERKRIAQELHDDVAQLLVALCQDLDLMRRAERREPARRPEVSADQVHSKATVILDTVRRFARALRPTLLDDLGLESAIRSLVTDLGQRRAIEARLRVSGVAWTLPDDVAITLFRAVQEALRNVERHANARSVLVDLIFGDVATSVTVSDDGEGFSPPDNLGSLARDGHLGLLGMQERVQLLGGTLELSSTPGAGTRLRVTVPDMPGPRVAGDPAEAAAGSPNQGLPVASVRPADGRTVLRRAAEGPR